MFGFNFVALTPNSYVEDLTLIPQNVILIGDRVFIEVSKLKWNHMTVALIKKKNVGNLKTHIQGEPHVNIKLEVRVMLLQTKEYQRLKEYHQNPGRDLEQNLLHNSQKEPILPTS